MPLTRRAFADTLLRAMALPSFAAWLEGQPTSYRPKFFTPEDFEALESYTAILIPTDETPGAREARCAHFIDFLLDASAEDPAAQATWRKTLATLHDRGFHTANAEARHQIVEKMSQQNDPAFHTIKGLNTFAFYTSKAGQIGALDYRGMSYNPTFPACTHPEHHEI